MSCNYPFSGTKAKPIAHQFNPYEANGGTVIAIAGDNFVVVGSDTRLSDGDDIISRDHPKLYQLTPTMMFAAAGNVCDVDEMAEKLQTDAKLYLMHHNREISVNSMSQNFSNKLYAKRLFPYVVYSLVCGLQDGKGCIYSFDVAGHQIEHSHRALGASEELVQPVLDSEIEGKHKNGGSPVPMTIQRAINLILDLFVNAAERNILTGDFMAVSIITEGGVDSLSMDLRKD